MRVTGEITVEIGADDSVVARRSSGGQSTAGKLARNGVDELLVMVFRRWLRDINRHWLNDEIQAFGSVLHRMLFPPNVWSFIEVELSKLYAGERMRLQLSFPAKDPELAGMPWEYLYAPDRPGRRGRFLGTDDALVLSRYVNPGTVSGPMVLSTPLKVLLVVSQPRSGDQEFDTIDPAAIVTAARKLGQEPWIDVVELNGPPTAGILKDALAEHQPHMLHFVGHGIYNDQKDLGEIALENVDRTANMISGDELAQLFGPSVPKIVLLQSCHGATHGRASFRGTAPQLVRHGVSCVIAMQDAVTPETAAEFGRTFLLEISSGADLDEAVQSARKAIGGPLSSERDIRLIGLPVLYLNRVDAMAIQFNSSPADTIREGQR